MHGLGEKTKTMSLQLKHVSKRVGADVHIHETSLDLEEGSFNTLLGPTLSGKTTLMHIMAGLDRPTTGEVWFGGKNVTGVPVQKRNVSMVYQQFINYPNLSVYENIASPLRVARMAQREIDERVGQGGRAPATDADADAPAWRTLRRPAAAHRDSARVGQGFRPHPARRATRQSRLQAARGAARRAAAFLRRAALHRRLCHHRADGGAAVRRQYRHAQPRHGDSVRPDAADLSPSRAI